MILSNLGNRLIFIFSLLGFAVSSFLLYEYSLAGPMFCPTGAGCDIVKNSPYSNFFGIPVPILGIGFYLMMAALSVVHSHDLPTKLIKKLQLFVAFLGVGFGVYLTYLEAFVIGAFCFWCVVSFIISLVILFLILGRKKRNYEDRN